MLDERLEDDRYTMEALLFSLPVLKVHRKSMVFSSMVRYNHYIEEWSMENTVVEQSKVRNRPIKITDIAISKVPRVQHYNKGSNSY